MCLIPAFGLGDQDGDGFGEPTQLGQSLGKRRPGRVEAPHDQQQARTDPGATDQGDDHDRTSESPGMTPFTIRGPSSAS